VHENSKAVGVKVSALDEIKGFPDNIIITCIFHEADKRFAVPGKDTVIAPSDRLFMCGRRKNILQAAKAIR
jgi:Trk K+ transport system NAD-binding subunit